MPKAQQYYNGYIAKESTSLAPRGTKSKTDAELALGAATLGVGL